MGRDSWQCVLKCALACQTQAQASAAWVYGRLGSANVAQARGPGEFKADVLWAGATSTLWQGPIRSEAVKGYSKAGL